jgi:excisionase family DNA binding protein
MAGKRKDRRIASAGQVMTVDQVAAYLQLNRLTVYRYIREGKIPAARFGKVYRVLKADVDNFLESHKVGGGRAAPARERVRAVWVREIKAADEISVGPTRRERQRERDPLVLSGDPLAVIMRSLN